MMDDELLQEFVAESWDNLNRLDVEIVRPEKEPGEAELLASIFRMIHTIKGTCGFLGLAQFGAVAHAGENVPGRDTSSDLAGARGRSGIYTTFEVQQGLPTKMLVKHFQQLNRAGRFQRIFADVSIGSE